MNVHALRLTQALGFEFCSDGRGVFPHLPVWNAELVRCPQIPTTLPTLDEMIGSDGVTEETAAETLLAMTATAPSSPVAAAHVFTLHAELEGMLLMPVLEKLIVGWKAQGYRITSMRGLFETLQPLALPRCEVAAGTIPGRSGTVFRQGREFLGDVDLAAAA
jgi:undecaprenyl phosphate-alpha-L-ara4FN deformylase